DRLSAAAARLRPDNPHPRRRHRSPRSRRHALRPSPPLAERAPQESRRSDRRGRCERLRPAADRRVLRRRTTAAPDRTNLDRLPEAAAARRAARQPRSAQPELGLRLGRSHPARTPYDRAPGRPRRQPVAPVSRPSHLHRRRAGPRRAARRGDHQRDAERPIRLADRGPAHLRWTTGCGRTARGARPPSRPTRPPVNPALTWNLAKDVQQLFVYPFMVNAIEAGTTVALMAAVTGWFVVLRRQTFAAHSLSAMSFPGASGAALAGAPLPVGYFLACVIAAGAIATGSRTGNRRNPSQQSAVIGAVQVVGFALGFLFLSLYGGVLENLESLLFGSFLGITTGQVRELLGVAFGTLVFFAIAGRPLLTVSLDEVDARARGAPVRMLEIAFLLVLGLAVAATAQITG